MTPLEHNNQETRLTKFAVTALTLSVLSLLISGALFIQRPRGPIQPNDSGNQRETTLQGINKTGILRVGYGGFPPYTIIDPKESDPTKRVKGFSVDLVDEIAQRCSPPLKVEWHNFSWETMKADMLSGKFDLIADPVFQTIPRAMDFGLSDPYSYFGIAVAVVRKDDNRFKIFSDLDREDITIALAEGWTSSEYARKNLSKPKFKSVSVGGDAFVATRRCAAWSGGCRLERRANSRTIRQGTWRQS